MKGLVTLALLLLLAAGCAGGNNGEAVPSTVDTKAPSGTTEMTGTNTTTGETREVSEPAGSGTTGGDTTGGGATAPSQTGDVTLEQLASGTMGPKKRQVLIATSARGLAAAGVEVPDSGEGTYIAVAWGEKPTGGYTVDFGSAGVEGVRVTVGVDLKEPPPDAMVSQALTYPYAVAVLRGVDAGEKQFVFVTRNGREIGWPVRNV